MLGLLGPPPEFVFGHAQRPLATSSRLFVQSQHATKLRTVARPDINNVITKLQAVACAEIGRLSGLVARIRLEDFGGCIRYTTLLFVWNLRNRAESASYLFLII
jgi:hypothetical protein